MGHRAANTMNTIWWFLRCNYVIKTNELPVANYIHVRKCDFWGASIHQIEQIAHSKSYIRIVFVETY